MKRIIPVVLATLGVIGTSTAFTISEIPKEPEPFMVDCPGEGDVGYWLLHGLGEGIPVNYHSEETEITVFSNGSLLFESIRVEYQGTHLCIRNHNDRVVAHPVSFRVRPKPPQDLWGEVYKTKFITGFLAALVCASIFALSCLVYSKRWRPTEESLVPIVSAEGYDNPALSTNEETAPEISKVYPEIQDGEDGATDTKM